MSLKTSEANEFFDQLKLGESDPENLAKEERLVCIGTSKLNKMAVQPISMRMKIRHWSYEIEVTNRTHAEAQGIYAPRLIYLRWDQNGDGEYLVHFW